MGLKEKIAEMITGRLEEEGFDLIEIKLAQYKTSHRLQLFVDSDNGVKLDDCVRLSKLIEPILEDEKVFKYGYTVEVSSPGLDRPLETFKDFRRRKGEKVRLMFLDEKRPTVEGELTDAGEDFVELVIEDNATRYELKDIKSGKIII